MSGVNWVELSDEEKDAWAADVAARTRAAQGLPRHVEDPVAIANLATILVAAASNAPPDAHADRRS